MKIRSKAPLRLGLAGGGTDLDVYCDEFTGQVLNASISLYCHCSIEPSHGGKITFEALDINENLTLSSKEHLELDGYMDLYKGVYNRMKDLVTKVGNFL